MCRYFVYTDFSTCRFIVIVIGVVFVLNSIIFALDKKQKL
jgi:hypothetical protein